MGGGLSTASGEARRQRRAPLSSASATRQQLECAGGIPLCGKHATCLLMKKSLGQQMRGTVAASAATLQAENYWQLSLHYWPVGAGACSQASMLQNQS